MDPKVIFTQKNLVIAAGAAVIIALGFVGYGIVTNDPTKDAREEYKAKSGQGTEVGEAPQAVASPAIESGDAEAVSVLPDGTTPTPTPTSGIPGVIESAPAEVELAPADPVMRENIFTTFPPVPETLINPSLPGTESQDSTTNVRTVTRIRADRWLFNNLSPGAVGAESLALASKDPEVGLNPTTFSPMGETIQLALMENATTERVSVNVMAAVWEPFYFQGNKLLDIGDKLLGKAAPGKTRDRMTITFERVIFKDGRSLPVEAVAQDIDGTYGVKGIKIGDVLLNSAGPLLLDTAASFFGVLQELAESATVSAGSSGSGIGLGQGQNQNSNSGNDPGQSAATTGVESGKTVFDTISDLLSEDIVDNQPYILIPAGTRLQALLTAPMDTSKAGYGK